MSLATGIKKIFRSARAVVLMYHRIAEPRADPWRIAVSRESFENQLNILSDSYNVISLRQLLTMLEDKSLAKNSICITFDDGYQDNYLYALPLLEKFACPATFFIASGNIGSNEPYWWDTLTEIFLLKKKLPPRLQLCFNNRQFGYELENDGVLSAQDQKMHTTWHWPDDPPTQRCKIYLELWMNLRDLPAFMIKEAIGKLIEWSEVELLNISGSFPMSRFELANLSQNKLVDTGVHTVTHAALAALPLPIQEAEIGGCREYLDENLNTKHTCVAYPYGNYNEHTRVAARNSGMNAAFTTDPKPVTTASDLFQLGRFQVFDERDMDFRKRLNGWLNK